MARRFFSDCGLTQAQLFAQESIEIDSYWLNKVQAFGCMFLRTKAQSLRQYLIKYKPELAVMVSGKPLDLEKRPVLNCPLYYAGKLVPILCKFVNGRH